MLHPGGGSGPAFSGARSREPAAARAPYALGLPVRFGAPHRHREWHLCPQTHYHHPTPKRRTKDRTTVVPARLRTP